MEEPNVPSSFNILKDSLKANNERIYSALRERIPDMQVSEGDESSDGEDVEIVFSGIDHQATFNEPGQAPKASPWAPPAAPWRDAQSSDAQPEDASSSHAVGDARKEFKEQMALQKRIPVPARAEEVIKTTVARPSTPQASVPTASAVEPKRAPPQVPH
jgi:hypothetical protein